MRTCIFCGRNASTNEDVWPMWLMNRFPVSDAAQMDAEFIGRNPVNWSTTRPRLRLKRVCRSCNNGWMSRLESEAKPIVQSILENELGVLETSTQLTLANWAVKTAMVLESLDSNRPSFYSQDERRLMFHARALPERTSVWIAKCVDQPNLYSAAKHLWTAAGDNGVQAFVVTMAFGSLALQVVTLRAPAAIPADAALTYDITEGPWDRILVPLWPVSQGTQTWPPSHGLAGPLGLEALTERLSVAT